eukprot:PhF_6_TR35045/c0_g1_i1/m.51066
MEDDSAFDIAHVASHAGVKDVLWNACKTILFSPTLSKDARTLRVVSNTIKVCVIPLRDSRRMLLSSEAHERRTTGATNRTAILKSIRKQIETEIYSKCTEMLPALEKVAAGVEGADVTEWMRRRADVNRYIAEVRPGEEVYREAALELYTSAVAFCKTLMLSPTDERCLALYLNYSVFCYEVLSSPDKACAVAKGAVDGAVSSPPTESIGDIVTPVTNNSIVISNTSNNSTTIATTGASNTTSANSNSNNNNSKKGIDVIVSVNESTLLQMLRHNLRIWTELIENPSLTDSGV